MAAPKSAQAPASASDGDLLSSIVSQGEAVRVLKTAKAPKPDVDKAVQQLLALKVNQLLLKEKINSKSRPLLLIIQMICH